MRKKGSYRKIILAGGLVLATVPGLAQDPASSQFYANPLFMNPAMAGVEGRARVSLAYRNQWPALSGTFVTSSASYDQFVEGISGGLGFQVMNDQAGKDQEAKLAATLKERVGKDVKLNMAVDESLIGGLIVKVGSKMIDTSIRSKLAALQNTMKEVG